MYEKHYGLSRKPFSISPDPDFLYLNSNYREAIALLQYAIKEQQGIVSLIGEVGSGKTMLLNLLLGSLPARTHVVKVPPIHFGFDELVSFVLSKLKAPDMPPTDNHQFDDLFDRLLASSAAGERVVLMVDEAQDLDDDSLESVRLLSNFETPSRKLLQILLVGQPELRRSLNRPALRQVKQRIAVSYELAPLSPDEVPSYIAHRLKSAGYRNGHSLFTADAIDLIARAARGIPRLVNALCDNALLTGYAANKYWIDVDIAREAVADLMLDMPTNARSSEQPRAATGDATSPVDSSRASTGARARVSPFRLVAVLTLLGLLLLGLFAQPLARALPTEWHQLLRALIDPTQRSTSAAAVSPGARADATPPTDAPSNEPKIAAGQSAPAPAAGPVPSTAESGARPAIPAPAIAGSGTDGARTAAPPNQLQLDAPLVPPQHKPNADSSGPAHGHGEPNTGAPSALATTRDPPGAPTAMSAARPVDDSADQLAGGEAEPAEPTMLVPTRVGASDAADRAVVAAATGPEKQPIDNIDTRPTDTSTANKVARQMSAARTAAEPGPLPTTPARPTPPAAVVTIQPGDTITRIASRLYGNVGLFELAAVSMMNPGISNLDVVDRGRRVVMPNLTQGVLLSTEADGSARVLLGAAPSLGAAKDLQARFEGNGVKTDIVPDQLSDTITAYRVESRFSPDGPPTAQALARLSTLRLKLTDSLE